MTFGFTTRVDLLSCIVAAALAAKLAATVVLLTRPVALRRATRDGRLLWWTTKLAPLIAAPAWVAAAWLTQDRVGFPAALALLAFVLVAVPLAIARRDHGSLLSQLLAAARAPHTPSPPSRPRR